jgi:hypothetical protein
MRAITPAGIKHFVLFVPDQFPLQFTIQEENFPTQFQALSVSHNLQIIFLGRFLPQEAYLLSFFKQKSEDRVQLIAIHLGAIEVDLRDS